MEDLIRQYRVSIRTLRQAKVKPLQSNSMISDTEWAIHYMESGSIPGTKWNVSRWEISKREIPVDPMAMARYLQNREPVSDAPEWMIELLERMMSTLSDKEKDAYELVRGRGYSYDQAAKILKCKKCSLQNHIRRAEKKLQKEVRKEGCCCEHS